MPLRCSNNAKYFCLVKMLKNNSSIIYKSLTLKSLQRELGYIIRPEGEIFGSWSGRTALPLSQ